MLIISGTGRPQSDPSFNFFRFDERIVNEKRRRRNTHEIFFVLGEEEKSVDVCISSRFHVGNPIWQKTNVSKIYLNQANRLRNEEEGIEFSFAYTWVGRAQNTEVS